MTTFSVNLKPEPNNDGKHALRIRFTSDRVSVYANTGIYIPLESWNKEGYLVEKKKITDNIWVVNYKFATLYNERLEKDLLWLETVNTTFPHYDRHKLKAAYLKYLEAENAKTDILEVQIIEPKEEAPDYTKDFLLYAQQEARNKRTINSIDTYLSYINKLQNYLELKHNKTSLSFEAANFRFFRAYKKYLLEEVKNSEQTVKLNFTFFNTVAEQAVRERIIEKNPFDEVEYNTRRNPSKKDRPTPEQLQALFKLRESNLKKATFLDALNFFFTQFYLHGARVSDVLELKWSSVTPERISYQTRKNQKHKSIKRNDFLNEILAYYGSPERRQEVFIFPYLRDKEVALSEKELKARRRVHIYLINERLKKMAKLAGIEISLSSHMARHSYADALLKVTNDINQIKEFLGHSSVQTTENYVQDLSQDVLDKTAGEVTF